MGEGDAETAAATADASLSRKLFLLCVEGEDGEDVEDDEEKTGETDRRRGEVNKEVLTLEVTILDCM